MSDTAGNNLGTPKHRITSPFPYSDRPHSDASTTEPTEWNNPGHLENEWLFELPYGSGLASASKTNENQEYFLGSKGGRCVGMTLPSLCADCLEI
jgi:hypothetical protein